MKYKIDTEKNTKFQPFSLTLTFETEEEYVYFHDHVMSKLKPDIPSHILYGSIYRAGNGEDIHITGKI